MGDQTVSSRVQIPLRLAWSISVHKSQGCVQMNAYEVVSSISQKLTIHNIFSLLSMTIPNLTVNLAGVFEYGQAYVGEFSNHCQC